MARGGKRGNPYRDANGRFASASTGRSGLGASRSKSSPAAARKAARSQSGRASTLSARTSLRQSRTKLAAKDPADQRLSSTLSSRAQKGAVTRGSRKLTAAKGAAKTKLQGAATTSTINKNRSKTVVATARPINQGGRSQPQTPTPNPPSRAKPKPTQRLIVVPALQGSNKLAPLSPQRTKVLSRAEARNRELAGMTNKAREQLEKARNKAIPANNPYSGMTQKERKAALTRLEKAEKTYDKLRKSSLTVQAAKMFATGFAGATKEGYTRYDNAIRISDIRTPKSKPIRPAIKAATPGSRRKVKGPSRRTLGTIDKPKALPQGGVAEKLAPSPKIDTKQAIAKATQLRQRANRLSRQAELMMSGGRKDNAIVNAPLSSKSRSSGINQGIKGSQLAAQAKALNNKADRILDRAIQSRKKAEKEALKPAKKQRSPESLRISRAKQIEKRRAINISHPAGRTESGAAILAANAAKTQSRALQFYKNQSKSLGSRSKPAKATPKPPSRAEGSRTRLPGMTGVIGKPKGLKPGALAERRVAKAAKDRRLRARLDVDAFAARLKRAKSAPIRRYINESDRENALTSAERRAVDYSKRYAASNMRQARTDKTAVAARAFYKSYGSASMFDMRQRQSTASSPSFGSRRRRKPKSQP